MAWHRSFPVNFAKFLRTPFLAEYFRWLLLGHFLGCQWMWYFSRNRMNLEWISSFSVMPEMSPLGVFFRSIFVFFQAGNITPVTPTHIYRKYHIATCFLIKIIFFHFPPKEQISYILKKRNTIFADISK